MNARTKKPTTTAPAVQVDLTDSELEVVSRFFARRKAGPPRAALRIDSTNRLGVDHPAPVVGWAIMGEAFGNLDPAILSPLLNQMANSLSKGPDVDLETLNGAIAVVQAIKPRDPLEAMLVSQMVGINAAAMTFMRRLNQTDTIAQQDSAVNGLTKLTRTFAAQMETLKRYRSAGDQKMTVEHVHVHAGGQAVVGNVTGGRGAVEKTEPTP